MRKALSVLSAAAMLAAMLLPVPVLAGESAYAKIDLDRCKTVRESGEDEAGDFIEMTCKGHGKAAVHFKEGDLRQAVMFGDLAPDISEGAFETFGPFNHMTNGTVEWRLNDSGTPVAAILRFTVENVNQEDGSTDPSQHGQVLVISRVGRAPEKLACVAGYVDALANPDANEIARRVADTIAPDFACGRAAPAWHGIKGDKAGNEMRNYPDLSAN